MGMKAGIGALIVAGKERTALAISTARIVLAATLLSFAMCASMRSR